MAVTDRDVDILKVLSSGPSTSAQVRTLLSKIYRHDMSSQALCNRLAALKKDGLVISQNYRDRSKEGTSLKKGVAPKWSHRLYALDEGAAETLSKFGYTRDKIRQGLPSPLMVTHDLMVTEVVRAIKREGSQLCYDYQIFDDKMIKTIDFKKNYHAIPDLAVGLKFIINKEHKIRTVAVEVDNDTEVPARVFRKVLQHRVEPLVLFICPTLKRLGALQSYMGRQGEFTRTLRSQNVITVKDSVYFAVFSDFCEHGFFETDFRNVFGRSESFMPTKGKITPFTDDVRY